MPAGESELTIQLWNIDVSIGAPGWGPILLGPIAWPVVNIFDGDC